MSEDKISVGEIIVATIVGTGLVAGTLKTVQFVKKSGGIKPAKDKIAASIHSVAAVGRDLLSDKETRLSTLKKLKKRVDDNIAKGKEEADSEEKSVPETPKQAEFEVVTGKVEHVTIDGRDVLETGVKQFVGYIPQSMSEELSSKIEDGHMGDAVVTGNTNKGVGVILFGTEVRVAGTVAIDGIQEQLEPLVDVSNIKFILEKEPENKEDKHAIKVYLTV